MATKAKAKSTAAQTVKKATPVKAAKAVNVAAKAVKAPNTATVAKATTVAKKAPVAKAAPVAKKAPVAKAAPVAKKAPVAKAAPVAKKASTPKAKKKPIQKSSAQPSTEFKLHAPDAAEVFLTGDFNDWDTPGYKARRFKDGVWKKMVKLKPGRYEYLFIVDGQWWTDPENPESVTNPFGTENSVCLVK